jgi:hypothetical protein
MANMYGSQMGQLPDRPGVILTTVGTVTHMYLTVAYEYIVTTTITTVNSHDMLNLCK